MATPGVQDAMKRSTDSRLGRMRVLLTGGAGYIGAHTAVALVEAGHDIAIVDDLSGVSAIALDRLAEITGVEIPFLAADVRDEVAVADFVRSLGRVDAVIHLAGVKSVAESMSQPLRYYDVNVGGVVSMLRVAKGAGARTVVFSSSATVYAAENRMPLTEEAITELRQSNPYGKSKRIAEEVLRDAARADENLRVVLLRYFNPVGAHPSGRIGEDPLGEPQNLMPIVSRVAAGQRSALSVYGDDYPTPDGTALRDYIHVLDLAEGHVAAVERAPDGVSVYNLGTGSAVSVRELVSAFEKASGRPVPTVSAPRRPGDQPVSYADPAKARRELGWVASRSIAEACADYWRWQDRNPRGYRD